MVRRKKAEEGIVVVDLGLIWKGVGGRWRVEKGEWKKDEWKGW